MRHLAGIGIALLALAGCQTLPPVVRIELGDATLEYKKKPLPPPQDQSAEEAGAPGEAAPTP